MSSSGKVVNKVIKRKDLSVGEKMILLKASELSNQTQTKLAKDFGISQSQVSRILKSKEIFSNQIKADTNLNRKRKRHGKESDVESALLVWFQKTRLKNVPLNRPVLQSKAEELALHLNIEDFKATGGWLQRWLKRENISLHRSHGKKIDADTDSANSRVPVATKTCQCGHLFFEERRRSTASNISEQDEILDDDCKSSRFLLTGISSTTPPGSVGTSPMKDSNLTPSDGKRRSERVKREKPNFYDALEYDNQMRKARRERQKEMEIQTGGRARRERKVKTTSDNDDDEEPKDKRKRKRKRMEKKEDEANEDIMYGITPLKELHFGIVLADINLKMGLNNPMFIKMTD